MEEAILSEQAQTIQAKQAIQRSLKNKKSSSLDSCLPDLIETLSCTIHIKDARTKKYVLANRHCIKSFDLSSTDDFIGLTADDLWLKSHIWDELGLNQHILAWRNMQLAEAEAFECQIKNLKSQVNIPEQIFFLPEGFIQISNRSKIPVFNHHKKVTAIVSIGQDVTSQHSLLRLFRLYRQYYPDLKSIELLSKYLKIDGYFYNPLTVREMQALLTLHQQPNRKKAARLLGISPNTLASHLQHIKEAKLIKPDLNEVLMQLHETPVRKNEHE